MSDTVEITILEPPEPDPVVTSITPPGPITGEQGEAITLRATVVPIGASVTWTWWGASTSPGVVTLTSHGAEVDVLFIDPGTVYVKAHASSLHPNEPTGMTFETSRDFSSFDAPGWSHSNRPNTVSTIEPHSTGSAGRTTLLTTYTGGQDVDMWLRTIENVGSRIYIHHRFMVSPNWQGHANTYSKIGYVISPTSGGGNPCFYSLKGTRSDPLNLVIHQQSARASINFTPNTAASAEITRGWWHDIEMELKLNSTSDNFDGECHGWVDGLKVIEYTNVGWTDLTNDKWQNYNFQPIWGGIGGSPPEPQWMQLDSIYISIGE